MKVGGIGCLCVLLSVLTHQQVTTWASDVALWSQARRVSPALLRPRINLAGALLEAGEPERAAAEIDAAVEGLQTARWHWSEPLIAPYIRRLVLRLELTQPACGHHAWSDYC